MIPPEYEPIFTAGYKAGMDAAFDSQKLIGVDTSRFSAPFLFAMCMMSAFVGFMGGLILS